MSTINNLDHIYIILSKQFEPERFNYIQFFLKLFPSDYCTIVDPFYKGRDDPKQLLVPRIKSTIQPVSLGAGFLYLTYEKLMNEFIHTTNYNTVLVLESDILFKNDVIEKLTECINEWITLENWENSMIFLGNGCNFKPNPNTKVTEHLYFTNGSKCTDSMLWTRNSISKILPELENLNNPIDFKLLECFEKNISKAYWIEPHIFEQGSQNGTYNKTI
jgi:hypothetical protein